MRWASPRPFLQSSCGNSRASHLVNHQKAPTTLLRYLEGAYIRRSRLNHLQGRKKSNVHEMSRRRIPADLASGWTRIERGLCLCWRQMSLGQPKESDRRTWGSTNVTQKLEPHAASFGWLDSLPPAVLGLGLPGCVDDLGDMGAVPSLVEVRGEA
jgi:hypothetical protein